MKYLNRFVSKDTWSYILKLICVSLGVNLVVEILNRGSIVQAFIHVGTNLPIFLYNSLIIFATLMIAILFRRRVYATCILSGIWIILGIANAVLLSNRVTPFSFVDITMLKDAISLLPIYFKFYHLILIIILVPALIIALVFGFKKLPKSKTRVNYIPNAVIIFLMILLSFGFTSLGIKTKLLARNFGNIADAYKDYGFAYCFMNSAINTGINKPSNYSGEVIEAIVAETDDELSITPSITEDEVQDTNTNEKKKKPNIIMLQLESFFDPNLMKNFTYSDNPVKTFTYLEENYPSGFLTVPSIGAGTANTEFEMITGMCLDFFGPGEYPYKTILKSTTCESIPYQLKTLGYSTHAIHNNDGTFYGRNIVFPNLGFNSFTAMEYMQNLEYNPTRWPKDGVLTEEIMKALTSSEDSDYIYTISVQGHGKYPNDRDSYLPLMVESGFSDEKDEVDTTQGDLNAEVLDKYYNSENFITIDGIDDNRKYAFEYYVNQIKEMDEFIKTLINALDEFDEDTVLVMYGDHLPSLGITEDEIDTDNLYQTEYVIWSNFDFDIEGKDLESFQLGAYVLEHLGMDCGYLTKMHQSNQYNFDAYRDKLELLQYDMLYGDQNVYGNINPYAPTDMKMGIDDITIDSVTREGDTLYVHGKNFTEFSYVYVNAKDAESTFISNELLSFDKKNEDKELSIVVSQRGDDHVVLSTSEPFLYSDFIPTETISGTVPQVEPVE